MSRKMIEAFERMRCAEDVCPYCGGRVRGFLRTPEGPNEFGNWVHHGRPGYHLMVLCTASAIHARHRNLMTPKHLDCKVNA